MVGGWKVASGRERVGGRARAAGGGIPGVDYGGVFEALPTPYLVLTRDLDILDANAAFLQVTGRSREAIIGRPIFEAFPGNPEGSDAAGVDAIRGSLERARDTGHPQTLPMQRYDIAGSAGDFAARFWSLISTPVLDAAGSCVLLLQRVEDITGYVRDRDRGQRDLEQEQTWRRRTEEAESDLFARGQELRAARDAEAETSRRLGALADVALQLASAQTVQELTGIVMSTGLAALNAGGGAVAVPTEDGSTVRLSITDSLGPTTQRTYGELPIDSPLPAAVAASQGRRILLADAAACVAFAPEMSSVLTTTGCRAWAALPLQSGRRVLGSLTVGWREAQVFGAEDVGLIGALAAQCAQALDRIQTRLDEDEANDRVRRLAETLQRSLLTDPPQPDHLQIAVRYLPAAEQAQVGGDWYDAFIVADGSTTLVIGDVAGHDRDAAAAMAQVRNVLRGVAHAVGEPPAAVLGALDRAMRDLDVGVLATAVLATIEQTEAEERCGVRTLRWCNAGHPPPLLIDADGTATLLSRTPDLLLGLDPSTARSDHEEVLRPGATVLLYTDGLVERRGESLDRGLEWLRATAFALGALPLEDLCDGLLAELGNELDDDVALLAIRAHPEDRPRPAEAGPERLPERLRSEGI